HADLEGPGQVHLDTFIWDRVFGYDMLSRHGAGITGGRFLSQVDLPRALEIGMTGGMWSITTNPFRSEKRRSEVFFEDLRRLLGVFDRARDQVAVVRTRKEYDAARAQGRHAALIAIQGGNALDASLENLDKIPDRLVTRITIVHLSSSKIGCTSSPYWFGGPRGLSEFGKDYVRKMNEKRILVDLAHISREGFFDAAAVHDRAQPLIVTHTGVKGVHEHWRNLDDAQLRAIAETGGTVGVMYQSSFLGPSWLRGKSTWIVDHLAHIIGVLGEDYASLGSDWDGSIIPPADTPTCTEFPKVIQHMLDRGWSHERIQKILAGNFLRVLAHIRPE
ncbi:MAG: membrane dipeptidase, partial [Candidatus Methylomirabilis sp.]|nr:membrane dipeptidase [Deltaproteobacteria bacterium]